MIMLSMVSAGWSAKQIREAGYGVEYYLMFLKDPGMRIGSGNHVYSGKSYRAGAWREWKKAHAV